MSEDIQTDWSTEAIVDRREKFYAASQRAFVPYKTPLIFRKGKGQYLWDEKDNKYIDLLAMNLSISVGHAHPEVNRTIREQSEDILHCTTMFYHPVPAHFAEELTAKMPAGHDWVVHFTSSGAEAADLALLMARSYTGNVDFLALQNGYHGATYGAQSMTGIAGFRHNTPLLTGVHHVSNPDGYRGVHGENVQAYLDDIDRAIKTSTSGALAGMMIEPVQGYGGIVPMLDGYLEGAAERVRAAGGVMVIDEVQSGFARTGDNFWGFEAYDVVPDIVIMAKGIGNGIPLGAVVAKRYVAEALANKFYFNTYGANPLACAVGRTVLKILEEEQLQQNARDVGAEMLKVLHDLHQRYDVIGDVRGRGLMMAIELVKDRKTREPATDLTAEIFEITRENGLVMSKSGAYRNVLRMVPPLCIKKDDVGTVADALDATFSSVL